MSENWFILRANVKYGPYPLAQMQEMLRAGELLPTDLVQKDGTTQWSPISAIPALATPVPPPPPLPQTPAIHQRLLGLWRRQSLLGKLGLALGAICGLLQALEWVGIRLGIISEDGGGNSLFTFWAFLKNTGIVGGLTTFCWESLKTKLCEGVQSSGGVAGDSPAMTPRASGIRFQDGGEEKEFAGLSFHQWFVTLVILFFTVLVSGILTAFVSGGRSVWVTFPALCVIGVALALMNRAAIEHTNFESRWGVVVGLSPFIFTLFAWGPCCLGVVTTGGMDGLRDWIFQFPKWTLLVYGVLIFLPTYRLFETLIPGTPPLRNSAGAWISVAYLALVVVLGVAIPLAAGKNDDPHGINQARQQLSKAEKLWDAGEKPKAIKEYKVFLKSDRLLYNRERYSAYRRVIDYEAENGDAGEAREWAHRALDECAGEPDRLSFQSPKARAMWTEIVTDWEQRNKKQGRR